MNKIISTSIRNVICFSIFMIFLSGCASAITGHKDSMNKFDEKLQTNNCDYTEIDTKIEDENDTILWGIQGGSLARNCFNYKKSIELFDKAEDEYKEGVDKDNVGNDILESSTSVLVNNNINNYEGNTYEKIMVNTYKALDFASINDHANARVEFNRALDRQRKAKEYFEKELKEKEKEISEKNKTNNKEANKNSLDTSKIANNKNTQDVIYKNYDSVLNGFEAYPDFVNPFTTYISGIYFLLNGDNIKARDLLKESLGMDKKNQQIKSDFNLSKKYNLKNSKEKYAWVIFENGQAMVKDELRIDIPLFLFTNKVQYTGIALPKIKERNVSYDYLTINNKKTSMICNMDNVIKTEFKKRFPSIVTHAVMNTVVKTIAQQQLNKNVGLLGGIVGGIYQGLTNKSDVRSWTALPKNFQSLRVKLDGKPFDIKNDKGEVIRTVMVPGGKNAIIYVRSLQKGNNKVHEMLF